MSLRTRLEATPETLGELELAANEKYHQGQQLIVAGYWDIGIYTLGYVAEMTLKSIYFRVIGSGRARPTFRVDSALKPAKNVGEALIPLIDAEMFHSIRFWAMLIQAVRLGKGLPLETNLALTFESCTERLYNNWWIGMRYRRNYARNSEALQVLNDVAWLRSNQSALWS